MIEESASINTIPSQVLGNQDEGFRIPEKYTQKRRGKQPAKPFTLKLMEILSYRDYEHIITWLPDGKAFKLLQPKEFTEKIMPFHLKKAKYSTFQRKMACWGFKKTSEDAQAGPKCFGLPTTFFHPYFQRNRTDLLVHVQFSKNSSSRSLATIGSLSSPKFVGMPKTPITACPELVSVSSYPSSPSLCSRSTYCKSLPPKKRFTRVLPHVSLEADDSALATSKKKLKPSYSMSSKISPTPTTSFRENSLASLLLGQYELRQLEHQRSLILMERDLYKLKYKHLLQKKESMNSCLFLEC